MSQWWRKISRSSSENNRIKENEASTSEEVFDSDLENWDEDAFCESPTLVTVDDGKGGIKHIKVDSLQIHFYFALSCTEAFDLQHDQ